MRTIKSEGIDTWRKNAKTNWNRPGTLTLSFKFSNLILYGFDFLIGALRLVKVSTHRIRILSSLFLLVLPLPHALMLIAHIGQKRKNDGLYERLSGA